MIQHVAVQILSSELDRCRSFYGLLGFREVAPPAGIRGRAVWMERSGSQIHLMPVPVRERTGASPGGHIGIVVDRYDDTVRLLRAGGYTVEPRREHWGSPRAYVRDPAGNLVELMARAPTGLAAI
jgi:catechol 2,3-dioxygenase-like lactoylglutathione lyase family enzyme